MCCYGAHGKAKYHVCLQTYTRGIPSFPCNGPRVRIPVWLEEIHTGNNFPVCNLIFPSVLLTQGEIDFSGSVGGSI
jgi:hypothetical protein